MAKISLTADVSTGSVKVDLNDGEHGIKLEFDVLSDGVLRHRTTGDGTDGKNIDVEQTYKGIELSAVAGPALDRLAHAFAAHVLLRLQGVTPSVPGESAPSQSDDDIPDVFRQGWDA